MNAWNDGGRESGPLSNIRHFVCFTALLGNFVSAACCGAGIADVNAYYHFTLTKDQELSVCSAYLRRLNSVDYYREAGRSSTEALYCSRPKNDLVKGFLHLNRLIKRPKILVFDEATNSLDVATAEHFCATINQLKEKCLRTDKSTRLFKLEQPGDVGHEFDLIRDCG